MAKLGAVDTGVRRTVAAIRAGIAPRPRIVGILISILIGVAVGVGITVDVCV